MRALSRLRDGLVGAWCPSVSGWGGSVLRDLSGQGNHGTLTNMDPATDWVVSDGKQALDFDGVNDRVNTSVSRFLDRSFTFSLWVFLRSGPVQQSLMVSEQAIGYWACIQHALNNSVSFALFDGTSNPVTPTWTSTLSRWTHVVGVRSVTSTKTIFLYVDGVLIGSTTDTTTGTPTYSDFNLGLQVTGGTRPSNCQISDARIYNRALPAGEVMLLAQGGPGYGLRPERTRRYLQGPTFTAARLRRQSLIGSGVY